MNFMKLQNNSSASRLVRSTVLAASIVLLRHVARVQADVKLPAIFGDHMVLQRDAKDPIWGWADPGETVTVDADGSKETVTAGTDGKWSLDLASMPMSSTPITITVSGKSNTIRLQDVLVGDVWVCSGQSNMEFTLKRAATGDRDIPNGTQPMLRLFVVQRKTALEPQTDCKGEWTLCTPQTAAAFSAVGYYFGKDISQAEHVPVGLIGSYWGGTRIQSWTSFDALQHDAEGRKAVQQIQEVKDHGQELLAAHEQWEKNVSVPYQKALRQWSAERVKAMKAGEPVPPRPTLSEKEPVNPQGPQIPTVLYNGMIAPLEPFRIKGATWYQGEQNAGEPMAYRKLLPAMIADWRTHWNEGDFPFLFVQLPNFMARESEPGDSNWAGMREAELLTLSASPNTGMAITIDLGQAETVHPLDKIDVGHRLALAAEHVAYRNDDITYSGPIFDSFKVEGNKIRVTFKDVGGGLKISARPATQPSESTPPPASELHGFAIAGEDHHFVWAHASLDGKDSVIVWSDQVPSPVAVRYGWANNPDVNLYNDVGLPASPFRTDDWPHSKN